MEHFLWVEKYRPTTIDETILPVNLKTLFKEYVSQGNIPNLILAGTPGCGKTTVARAMLEELGCSYIMINGSLDGTKDTLRNEIRDFAISMSFDGKRKYVILDEADYVTPLMQAALRNFMEEFSSNCGFILTCNFKDKIIEPLHSRCSLIEFKYQKSQRPELALQVYKRIVSILNTEHIQFEKNVLVNIITKHFPDYRKILNELQKYSVCGKIDSGILVDFDSAQIKKLIEYMKDKNFTEVRKWVNETELDDATLYRKLYDSATTHVVNSSIPQLVLILARYMYNSSFCADKEINTTACLVECMLELEFK